MNGRRRALKDSGCPHWRWASSSRPAATRVTFERARPPDLYTFIPDLDTADRFDTLAALLSKRGHSDARIDKIPGGNFARVMRDVWN